jgi:hypothetical protein
MFISAPPLDEIKSLIEGQRRELFLEVKRAVPGKERRDLARQGRTLPGTTSYPIKTRDDLANAIKAYGRAKPADQPKLKAFLLRMARKLNALDLIPDDWKSKTSGSKDFTPADG